MKIIIAIPAYNEEQLLRDSITSLNDFCTRHLKIDWQIVIADNASTDTTGQIGRQLENTFPKVKYLRLNQRGKGRAIKAVWQTGDADIYVFMDADLATGLEALPRLIEAVAQGADVAVGSRFHPESKVKRNWLRLIISYGYRFLAKIFVSTKVRDLSCGFKAISHKVKQEILPLVKDQAWFFDSELTVLAENKGFKIKQIPVTWNEKRREKNASRVNLLPLILSYLKKLISLRRRLALRRGITGQLVVKTTLIFLLSIILMLVNIFNNEEVEFAKETFGILINFTLTQRIYLAVYLVKSAFLLWGAIFGLYFLAHKVVSQFKKNIPPDLLVIPFLLIVLVRSIVLEPYLYHSFYSSGPLVQKIINGLLFFDLKITLDLIIITLLVGAFWLWLRKKSWIPIFILVFLIFFPSLQMFQIRPLPSEPKETLLMIVVDSFRRDYAEANPDSFLAQIINESIILDRVYTPNPASVPAVAAIFSGEYPYKARATFIFLDKQLDLSLINEIKQDYGLYFISDFADDEVLNRQNYNIDFDQAYAPRIDFETHIVGFVLKSNVVLLSMIDPQYRNLIIPEFFYTEMPNSREIMNKTIRLLDENRDQQKIVFMSESDLHIPLMARYPYYRQFLPSPANRFKFNWGYADYTYQGDDSRVNQSLQELYQQSMQFLDENLQYMFEQLKRRNLLANTTILLTSDHGESLFDDNLPLNSHNHLDSRDVLNVPFYLYNTGLVPWRDTVNNYVLNDALKIGLDPENITQYARDFVYIENDIDLADKNNPLWGVYDLHSYGQLEITDIKIWHKNKNRAVIADQYQLSYHPSRQDPYALYDIDADPLYQNDLKEELPVVFNQLKQQLDEFIEDSKKY